MNKKQESKFKELITGYAAPPPDEQKKRQAILLAQEALQSNAANKTPLLLLLLAQARFISKPLWLLQLAAILITWVFGNGFENVQKVESFLFVVIPIIAFYTVPEYAKARVYGMSELEMACKNSPVKIAIAKLCLIGSANILAIVLISLILSNRYNIGLAKLIAFGFLPFNAMNIVTLLATDIFRAKASFALLSVSFVAALAFVFGSNATYLLEGSIEFYSIASAALLIGLLIFSIKRTSGRQDILAWN